ncbi:transglycosylase SLT domain-containing protein [Sandaracinobacter sp. RS1-74]|uniref:lytic transglycosylase domain-containing protein n=1 Tax=Sandaracinobacteroides sayramensis TaxID=2913411 RepID=UPI001ED9D4A1|nr:transglycosylase SLT domain-containing protein [Sandaracinobacteroides sayramensis]MCG2840067.1 transglycosylase SLT domain-containing protein [Sandaracinobacteroides sayramensis]
MSTGPFSGSAAALPPRLARAAAQMLPALSAAANRTGADFGALFNTARLESGFNPDARARTSSATGLFQFIDSTWLGTLARHGPAHGIGALPRSEALALRRNPMVASLMAAEHMADNARALQGGLGRAVGQTDLYLAHFLGVGGALKFLRELASSPGTAGATLLPAAARANRAIFYEGGAPRSLQQIYALLDNRLSGQPAPPAEPRLPPVTGSPAVAPRGQSSVMPPAGAARIAYLLLAELGG